MRIFEEAKRLDIELNMIYRAEEFDFAFIEFELVNDEWKIVYKRDLLLMQLVQEYEYEIDEAHEILDYDFQMFILI